MSRGFFITLEGPEGSGKSSQARRLVAALTRAGHSVVLVRDPGSTLLGRRLRRVLLHTRAFSRMAPMTEALLFLAGRAQLVQERIRPALARDRVVVCDRFHDSTLAYQGAGGVDAAWLDRIGRAAIGSLMPNLTILLDLPTQRGFARLGRRRDRMEAKDRAFHRRVRAGYRRLARREPKRVIVIDAAQSPATVHRAILAAVLPRLSRRK